MEVGEEKSKCKIALGVTTSEAIMIHLGHDEAYVMSF